jgi:twitching motility protein PilJ
MASSKKSRIWVPVFFFLVLGSVTIAAGILIATTIWSGSDQEFTGYTHEQATLAQAMAKDAHAARLGDRDAFSRLVRARDRMDSIGRLILGGNQDSALGPAEGSVLSEAQLTDQQWQQLKPAVNIVLDTRDTIDVVRTAAESSQAAMPALLGDVENMQQALRDAGLEGQLYQVGRFATIAQRSNRAVSDIVNGVGDVAVAGQQLTDDEAFLDRVLRGLMNGDPVLNIQALTNGNLRAQATALQSTYASIGADLRAVSASADEMSTVDQAVDVLIAQAHTLASQAASVRNMYQSQVEARPVTPVMAYYAFGAAIFFVIGLYFFQSQTTDTRLAEAKAEEDQRKNQEAILRLLDELGSLADGDLSIQVTVTEDITGAIADSINFTIEALRDLVATITTTAGQVNAAAQQTRSITDDLAKASDDQNNEITAATGAITTMAKSIEQVSANAERSAKVAQQSVDIAHKGGEAVRRTIAGMNTIRETIQETSKRIKRLGESSQEIGDIVELINDIAEQTNILALNASIQASMAGEAGRGFAVVADEVQRLAERAGNATRQIEALVKTIQSDTNEAVSSMERSTSDVVSGAQLAENAGRALDEIEKVSNHIATLVQSISNSARQQSTQATDVSETMNVIQGITEQTADGTRQTAKSVSELVQLAAELRRSVSGFKLPEHRQVPDPDMTEIPQAQAS